MELVVLGSGGFLPQPDRPLPGFAVRHEGSVYLLDAGEGTQVRMVEHGVSSARLESVCLSHLHGDHLYGLPGVMVCRSQEGQRTEDLELFGPSGLRCFLEGLEEAGAFGLLYDWKLNELSGGASYEIGDFEITMASLDHRIENYGFALQVVRTKRVFLPAKARELGIPEGPLRSKLQQGESVTLDSGRTVEPEEVTDPPPEGAKLVYLTDTRPCYDLPEAFEDPDLLVHEGMFLSEHLEQAREKKHCTAREAARVAKHLGAGKLLLTHFSHRYSDETVLRDEARGTFPETDLARPGEVHEIS